MDFLKTLMLYMTMTFAASVQSAPTPEITAVPTQTPVAVVSTQLPGTTPTAVVTLAPGATATAAPSVTATPVPQPTITPNPAYKTLQRGDRGDSVKTLQTRLIELGYLTGEADGAYGNQTRRAVQRFQYYNGLQQDGVAGKATQTVMYEEPNVVYYPDAVTAAPEAAATPDVTATPDTAATPGAMPTIAMPSESASAAEPTLVPPAADRSTEQPTTAEKSAVTTAQPAATEQPAATAEPAVTTEQPATATDLLVQLDASVVVNDAGAPLTLLRQEDGVTVSSKPRLYLEGDRVILSLDDLCAAQEAWTLTADEAGNAWTLDALGYHAVVTETTVDGAKTMTVDVDGTPVALDDGEVRAVNGRLLVRASFLEKALGAEVIWDAEESAVMLRCVDKAIAQAKD